MTLSQHFSRHEFACECEYNEGCGGAFDVVDYELLLILEAMRDAFGRCTITGPNRCEYRNSNTAGAAEKSTHTLGKAADVRFASGSPEDWAKLADKLGAGGIGVYSNRIHIDTRNGRARWYG